MEWSPAITDFFFSPRLRDAHMEGSSRGWRSIAIPPLYFSQSDAIGASIKS
jgi:hypothetical protein